jgi:hypothetical protein
MAGGVLIALITNAEAGEGRTGWFELRILRIRGAF